MTVIILGSIIAILLGSLAAVSRPSVQRKLGWREFVDPGTPVALPSAHMATPSLPTRNERWVQEQEHILEPDGSFEHHACRVCGPGPLGRNEIPSAYDHVLYREVTWGSGYSWSRENQKIGSPADAETVSSEIEGYPGWHTPVLDIDVPTRLIESSTPGHFHLYIDMPIKHDAYMAMVSALADAGVVEKEFYRATKRAGYSQLRVPWLDKEQ